MPVKKADEVPVEWGKLLENQLERWRGGGQHGRGIAEYITNSDDDRRQGKYKGQVIKVEIHSKRGRHTDKLIVKDFAEGMNFPDLEKKFLLFRKCQWKGRRKKRYWSIWNRWESLCNYEFFTMLDKLCKKR